MWNEDGQSGAEQAGVMTILPVKDEIHMPVLYLSEQQSIVKKHAGCLIVHYTDQRSVKVPLMKVSQVVISGDVTLTTGALHALLEAEIEVCFLSISGQFRGRLSPSVTKHALLRREQYRAPNGRWNSPKHV